MKSCLIVCNGPSLNDIPDELLEKYHTFGSNRIYLRFDPDYYAVVNPLVIEQYYVEISRMNSVKFVRATHTQFIPGCIRLYTTSRKTFSSEPLKYIYEGYTVTYVLMQLALFSGYKRVGLVGCDHRYDFDGEPNQKLKSEGKDTNHFSPDYFADGAVWNAPDLVKSEESYRLAKEAYLQSDAEIVNLTPNSALDVFKKEDWHDW